MCRSFIDQFQQSHNYWDWVPSSCLGLWSSEHQICIGTLSNIAAVTIKAGSLLKSNDIISSEGSQCSDAWSGLTYLCRVCVLLNVAPYCSPHSHSWAGPSPSDILNCNPLMSHKMYWLGNEGTSYTLLTTTLISSGSSPGPGKQNNSPAFYPPSLFILLQQIMATTSVLYQGYFPIRVW